MVCLGNICRSPLAEAVLVGMVESRNLAPLIRVDSAGTAGYHVGSEPDERTIETCRKHGVPINSRCRQLKKKDFDEFDYIVAS